MNYIRHFVNAVHLAALIYFAIKYLRFDIKSSHELNLENVSDNLKQKFEMIEAELKKENTPDKPEFDRFVFFLLDAWRWNFLFNENTVMKNLKNKILGGEALGMVALARIPTVTKPCLKSIFAGTQPVFFEIVENIDESGMMENVQSSTGTSQDNLLQRLKAQGKKLAVYGDDVWSKLFPISTFHRHDMAFGFNIMDYTEVDNLVHRGFETEKMAADDASDVIILHYLGLDHIGHSFSARPEYVIPKLEEMDDKIEEIYEWIKNKDVEDGKKTLFLVMGDHGMTADGNHGGGSKDESQAAAVFISPHFRTEESPRSWSEAIAMAESNARNQEDIAATLTALLDSSNPLKYGHGCLIEKLMQISSHKNERKFLLQNLKHLLRRAITSNASKVEEAVEDFGRAGLAESEIYSTSKKIKSIINDSGFTFEEGNLKAALFILFAVLLVNLFLAYATMKPNLESIVDILAVTIIAACQSATSFIDEEHLLWQAAFSAIIFVWIIGNVRPISKIGRKAWYRVCKILILHRILSSWNAVGSIYVNEITIGKLLKSNHAFEIVGLLLALAFIIFKAQCSMKSKIIYLIAGLTTVLHKLDTISVSKHLLARSVLFLLIIECLSSWNLNSFSTSFSILCVLINKPFNSIPVAIISEISAEFVSLESDFNSKFSSLLRICAIQCSYYGLGLWNSVSAIDLTFGAIFSKSFDMKLAPIVLLVYCFSGPILTSISFRKSRNQFNFLEFSRSLLDFAACAFAYHHRFHAWVFDFFSPKVLFQVIWAVFYILLLPLLIQ